MDFATERFAENGYHPTSVAEIVQGLGVGKGVFYWYFSSKEELFLEILREAHTELRRRQKEAITGLDDPIRRLEAGIHASVRWYADQRSVVTLFQVASTEERFAPALRRGQQVAVADVVRHVEDGIRRGVIRDSDPSMIAHAILGVTTHLARVFVHERGDDPEEVAAVAARFCLEGLLADRRPAPV